MIVRKVLAVAVILLFIGVSVIPSTGTVVDKKFTMSINYGGNTLYVGGNGLGNYTRIQDAIDNASDGDTVFVDDDYTSSTPGWQIDHFDNMQNGIDRVTENGTVFVYNGTYYENVIVNKTINFRGENKNSTIIDGSGSGDVMKISADLVNITGFTTINGGNTAYDAGIKIQSNNSIILDNIFINNRYGIFLSFSNNNTIINNTLDAYFLGFLSLSNQWDSNYWGKKYLIKPIFGGFWIPLFYSPDGGIIGLRIPLVKFDRHPAKEPYDI